MNSRTSGLLHVVSYSDTRFVRAAQGCVLWNLVRRHELTTFGVDHNFELIETIEDFQRWVPLQSYQKPSVEPRLGEHLCVTPRSTARAQLGSLVDIVSPTSKWLDIEYCIHQSVRQSGDAPAPPAPDDVAAVLQRFAPQPVEVMVVPTAWLGIVSEFLGRRRYSHQTMRSTLRLIIATHCHAESLIGDVRAAMDEICPAVTLLAAYQTPDGIISGVETSPGSELYRMLVTAGVYFEFACQDGGGALGRLGLESVVEGGVYELCVSTKRGLFAYRTGIRVLIAQQPVRQGEDASPKRHSSWSSGPLHIPLSAGALPSWSERMNRKTYFC